MLKHYRAFTLVEVLMTLALIAILAAISFPALREWRDNANDVILQNTLIDALDFARAEAQTHAFPIGVCKSTNHITCGGNWGDDELVFIDENADGVVLDKAHILSVIQIHDQHGTLYFRAFPSYRDYIQFNSLGLARNDNGTLWHCHRDKIKWAIILNKFTGAQIEYPDQQGVIKDSHAKPLLC